MGGKRLQKARRQDVYSTLVSGHRCSLPGLTFNGIVRPEAARQLLAAQPSKSRPSLFVGRTAEFDPEPRFRPPSVTSTQPSVIVATAS
jgi:hypothetical protein